MPPLMPPPTPERDLNREGWLTELAKMLEPHYRGFELGDYRVTCGWPSTKGLGTRSRTIGECWDKSASPAGRSEIFISPVLQDPVEVGGVLCHEMAHIAAGHKAGHGPKYKRVCRHVGLFKGKPTQAMPGDQLEADIRSKVLKLGAYPHRAISPRGKELKVKPGPVTLECGKCGCKCSMTLKWHETSGSPTCGCGHPMTIKSKEDGDGE